MSLYLSKAGVMEGARIGVEWRSPTYIRMRALETTANVGYHGCRYVQCVKDDESECNHSSVFSFPLRPAHSGFSSTESPSHLKMIASIVMVSVFCATDRVSAMY